MRHLVSFYWNTIFRMKRVHKYLPLTCMSRHFNLYYIFIPTAGIIFEKSYDLLHKEWGHFSPYNIDSGPTDISVLEDSCYLAKHFPDFPLNIITCTLVRDYFMSHLPQIHLFLKFFQFLTHFFCHLILFWSMNNGTFSTNWSFAP